MKSPDLLLPFTTNRTVQGPLCKVDGKKSVIEYDYQNDDGSTQWVSITFDQVLRLNYRQAACCASEDVLPPDELVCLESSDWLDETIEKWTDSVGWQEWQQKQGGAFRFRHYKLYFDDAAFVEVIAASHVLETRSPHSLVAG